MKKVHGFWILVLLIETSFYGVFNFRLYNSPKNKGMCNNYQERGLKNEPKVSLKKWIRIVSNFIDVIQFYFLSNNEVESKRTVSMFRKRTFLCNVVTYSIKRAREIWKFHVIFAVVQQRQRNVQKRDARAELLCC